MPWALSFGSAGDDWINRVIALRDGHLLAVGYVSQAGDGEPDWDGIVHKLTTNGTPLWTRRFGGGGRDALWSAAEMPDGRLALAGFSAGGDERGLDLWLLILGADGELLTERRFGGPGDELGIDVVAAAGLLLVGQTGGDGTGEIDALLIRTDDQGRELWRRTYGDAETDRGFYAVPTADGGFVVAGVTGARDRYDMLVFKVDATGREVWSRTVGAESNDPNHGINLLPDGRVVAVGYSASWGASEHDLMAVVLSPDGEILTHELLGGPGDDRVMNSLTTADGGTWLVGYTTSFSQGDRDLMLARLTPEGTFEPWMGVFGTKSDDYGSTAVELPDRDLIVGGWSADPGLQSGGTDLLLLRVAPSSIERHFEGVEVRKLAAPDRRGDG